jgi:hypothetical protein
VRDFRNTDADLDDLRRELARIPVRPAGTAVADVTPGYTIRFRVITLDEESRTALCTITAVECGGSLSSMPGQDITPGEIEVCDPTGCFFNEPSGTILGRAGWAKWMTPLEPSVCQPDPDYFTGEFACQWEVFAICCATVICRES